MLACYLVPCSKVYSSVKYKQGTYARDHDFSLDKALSTL